MTNPSANEKVYINEIQGLFREILACLKILALYPENHPAHGPALERTFRRFEALLTERGSISLGVAEEEIIVFGKDDAEHRITTELAERLHQLGMLTLKFEKGLDQQELGLLLRCLTAVRDASDPRRAIREIVEQQEITNAVITFVDYRRIIEQEASEESKPQAGDLWTNLIQKALNGDNGAFQDMVESLSEPSKLQFLNEEIGSYFKNHPMEEMTGDEVKFVSDIHQRMFQGFSVSQQQDFSRNLAKLVLSEDAEVAGSEKRLSQAFLYYPDEMLLKVLASAVVLQGSIDNRIRTAFRELLNDTERRESLRVQAEAYAHRNTFAGYTPEAWKQICNLFLSGSEDPFMSKDYHKVLQDLNKFHLDDLRETLDEEYLREVQQALRPNVLQKIRMEVIFDLLLAENKGELYEQLPIELRSHLGKYAQARDLTRIAGSLNRLLGPEVPLSPARRARIEEVLFERAENFWVASLVREIGTMDQKEFEILEEILGYSSEGLADILIEQLGGEGSISGRKRLSNLLVKLGARAVPTIQHFLGDKRWFLVRNLVMILGKIEDDSSVDELFDLLSHDHFRVRKEVLMTLSIIGGDRVVPQIRRILLNRSRKVEESLQAAAGQALKRIGTPKARRVLQEGLEDRDKKVQEICCQVLKGLV